jgi:hypothetical protein
MNHKRWFAEFIKSLPLENRLNLKKHAEEKVGIFNPGLYSDREMS